MRESGVGKVVESSCFERIKAVICQQIHRQGLGKSAGVAGGLNEGCDDALIDRCQTPGKDWKRCTELVEEMEPKCSTNQNEIKSLRQLEQMEKETLVATDEAALSAIQKDLEVRRTSARKKVRCRQHRLDCILEVFQSEADSIICQLESSDDGTEVDFSTSQRVMRLKGMMREAMLTAENLGSARREAISVELIYSSCGLMRKMLNRLKEPLLAAQLSQQRTASKVVEESAVLPIEMNGDGDNMHSPNNQAREIQPAEGCETCATPPVSCSNMEEKTAETWNNDLRPSEEPENDSATKDALKDALAPTLTFINSFSHSSSLNSSFATQSVASFFHVPFLGSYSHYSSCLLSFLVFLLSSLRRAASSEQRVPLRSKLSSVTPKSAQRLANRFKDLLRGKVMASDPVPGETKFRVDGRSQLETGSCVKAIEEVELAGSWIGWQQVLAKRIRLSVESICNGRSWHWTAGLKTMGWMSPATAGISISQSLPVKVKRKDWEILTPGYRFVGRKWLFALFCLVAWSLSTIFFDQSLTVVIKVIGRMIRWTLFDPLVDLRHRELPPI